MMHTFVVPGDKKNQTNKNLTVPNNGYNFPFAGMTVAWYNASVKELPCFVRYYYFIDKIVFNFSTCGNCTKLSFFKMAEHYFCKLLFIDATTLYKTVNSFQHPVSVNLAFPTPCASQ